MNKVYISGKVVHQPVLMGENEAPHLIVSLRVTHRKRNGERRSEDYHVNAWNRVALWGKANLEQGQIVALQGYLTQNAFKDHATEITAEEFMPLNTANLHQDMDVAEEPVNEAADEIIESAEDTP